MNITIYKQGQKAEFYIQRIGIYGGKPMKNPTANCFKVTDSQPLSFEFISAMQYKKVFTPYIGGTCVPYLRLRDFKKLVSSHLKNQPANSKIIEYLKGMNQADHLESNLKSQLKKVKQLRQALANQIFN